MVLGERKKTELVGYDSSRVLSSRNFQIRTHFKIFFSMATELGNVRLRTDRLIENSDIRE